jgi:hypothetical protein
VSATNVTALDLIRIGQNSLILLNPSTWDVNSYANAIPQFITYSEKCGFSNCATAAKALEGRGIRYFLQNNQINPADASGLVSAVRTIEQVLNAEAGKTTAILSDANPPVQLDSLANLEPHQEALRVDLVTCLRAHLARPAIVMAWALAYDLVRSWVFNDTQGRLDAFNRQLASSPRRGEPAAINDYHDYFRVGEVRFLEICRDSQDASLQRFTDRTFRDLQGLLDHRNEFAHANYSQANEHEANAYVVRVIRIVTSPPFA